MMVHEGPARVFDCEEDAICAIKGGEIKAGDVTFCKDGDGHGIKNHGTEPIIFIALVLKK